jgi:hypothetical protein
MIPMAPFALIGFEKIFPKNRIAFIAVIVIAAILSLIYTWTVIPINPMPEETYLRIRETIAMM